MIYSNEWPGWLKFLVITAIVVTALASIWGQIRDSRILRAVARELLIKDGEDLKSVDKAVADAHPPEQTVKSQVTKAADDSKTALDILEGFKVEYNTRHMLLEDRVKSLEDWRRDKDKDGEVVGG